VLLRSADWELAVSPVGNRRGSDEVERGEVLRITKPRYCRLAIGATKRVKSLLLMVVANSGVKLTPKPRVFGRGCGANAGLSLLGIVLFAGLHVVGSA